MRMCPAENQVLTQLSYPFVRIVQKFRAVEDKDETGEYEEEIKTTVESRNGIKTGTCLGSLYQCSHYHAARGVVGTRTLC